MIHCEGNRIIVQGEVTIDTVAELTRCGMAVLDHPQMQVDLNAVTEMDSTTIISMLLEWFRAANRQGLCVVQREESGVDALDCEMEQVEDDEAEHHQPAQEHPARSGGGANVPRGLIAHGPCGAVLHPKLHRGDDVDHEHRQQDHPYRPEQFVGCVQKSSVAVDRIRTEEDLEIPDHVADDKCDEHDARNGDGPLAADG